MKKLLVVVLVLVMATSLIACTTSNQPTEVVAEAAETNEAEEATEEVEAEVAEEDSGIPERTGLEPEPTKKEGPIKVGFCPTAMNTHYQIVINGCLQKIEELGGEDVIELIIQAPTSQSAQAEQVNIIEGWLQTGIDAIVICTANDGAMEPVFKQAAEKGVPVFEFNQPISSSINPYYVANVGYDQYSAGYAIGEWMVNSFGNDPTKIAVLEGLPGVHNTERYGGFKDAIAGHDNLNIVASQPADWVREKGQSVTENILTSNPDIDVLWGIYDEMALGGLAAVKSRGLLDQIKVVGYDNTPDAYEAIVRGEMYATVDTAPKAMGEKIIEAVVKYVMEGEMVPKLINCDVKVFDQTNIDEFDTDEYEFVK